MSAPPIGMMMSTPKAKAAKASSQKARWLSARANKTMSTMMASASDVDGVSGGKDDGRAAHAAGEFQERNHRAGEGDGADGDAERHLDEARLVDRADGADVERRRRVERPGSHQHRRHADQRMERRDQFRHRSHRH